MAKTQQDKVLVIGTNGYVGKSIAGYMEDFFGQGNVVCIGGSKDSDWAMHWEAIKSGDFGAIRNVAGSRFSQPEEAQIASYLNANAYFPADLARASGVSRTPIFHISSRWTIGESGEGPNTIYGATKALGDAQLAREMQRLGVPFVIARIRETFGINDPRGSLISTLASYGASGKPLPLTPGLQISDPIFVDDIAIGACLMVESLIGGATFNGFFETIVQPQTVRQIVDLWQSEIAPDLNPLFGELPYRGIELFKMDQVHPALPYFNPRNRGESFSIVYKAATTTREVSLEDVEQFDLAPED